MNQEIYNVHSEVVTQSGILDVPNFIRNRNLNFQQVRFSQLKNPYWESNWKTKQRKLNTLIAAISSSGFLFCSIFCKKKFNTNIYQVSTCPVFPLFREKF